MPSSVTFCAKWSNVHAAPIFFLIIIVEHQLGTFVSQHGVRYLAKLIGDIGVVGGTIVGKVTIGGDSGDITRLHTRAVVEDNVERRGVIKAKCLIPEGNLLALRVGFRYRLGHLRARPYTIEFGFLTVDSVPSVKIWRHVSLYIYCSCDSLSNNHSKKQYQYK